MTSYDEITQEQMISILKSYIDAEYWVLNDFPTIIERATILEERDIVIFKLSFMDLYLDTRDLSFVDAHPKFS